MSTPEETAKRFAKGHCSTGNEKLDAALAELREWAFESGFVTVARRLKIAVEALKEARDQLDRIVTAPWSIHEARLGAKSGLHGVTKALAEIGDV